MIYELRVRNFKLNRTWKLKVFRSPNKAENAPLNRNSEFVSLYHLNVNECANKATKILNTSNAV